MSSEVQGSAQVVTGVFNVLHDENIENFRLQEVNAATTGMAGADPMD